MICYGLQWPDGADPLALEFTMVQQGYATKPGFGLGLVHHYKEAQKLMWPTDDHHRWSDLMLDEILKNRLTAITGSRDSGKTHVALARYGLTDYFMFPNDTLLLISSTDLRGLQMRVFGDLKDMHKRALEMYPWLPGNVVESKNGIFTDELSDDCPIRDQRRGIICIPCLDRKGTWIGGLEKFVGIKQKRRRLLGDEVQFMHREYLTILSNLDEGDFKGVFVGNTLANKKALDCIAEPVEGWENRPQPTKTDVFKNKFDGYTIQLIGTDSPNWDHPADAPIRYKYMVNRESEKRVGDRWGRDSEQYHSQITGLRKTGLFAHRVLTEEMCKTNGAFDKVIWSGKKRTKVYSCDMAFGGDRCVAGWCEFGEAASGDIVFRANPPVEIQISVESEAEEQISQFIKKDCAALGIPGANVFFDAGMKATAATSLAKIFSHDVNAVNFGGRPTTRPVSADEYVLDKGIKRLKRCEEHYDRFLSEMWFSVRFVVLSRQMKELPTAVANEFYEREWTKGRGDKYELETKEEMKERVGYSPDYADWMAIAVEGARRLGFQIKRLGNDLQDSDEGVNWLEEWQKMHETTLRSKQLVRT